jgi:hypothetical protein
MIKKIILSVVIVFVLHSILSIENCQGQWVQIPNGMGTSQNVYCITACGNNIFAGTYNFVNPGSIYASSNYGNLWTTTSMANINIRSFAVNGNYFFAGTYSNGVYVSSNAGNSFTATTLAGGREIEAMVFFGNYIFAGTYNFASPSGLYLSSNNGLTWQQTSITTQNITALASNSTYIFAGTTVGNTGNGVSYSTNNGTTFYQTSMNNKWVYSLCVVGNTIFAGTKDSGLYRSTNNGISWTQTAFTNKSVITLAAVGKNIFAGTNDSNIYYSKTAGIDWLLGNQGFSPKNAIYGFLINNNYLYAATWGGSVWRRSLSEMLDTISVTVSRHNLNKTIGPNQSTNDTINISDFKSTILDKVTDVNLNIDSVLFTPDNQLEFTLIHENVYDTVVYHAGGSGSNFIGTYLNDSATVLIGNASPPFTGTYRPYRSLSLLNGTDLRGTWILRIYNNGSSIKTGVIKSWSITITYRPIIGIKNISSEVPSSFLLNQNYPNPFNPNTNIRYQISNNSFVSMKLYDALGRNIETLVNEKQSAGTYEANWDASNYPSGVYFYKLEAGDFSQVKKMILIK